MSTITTKDGTQIYYKDWGSGQPVVFSHGWPLSADAWEDQMLFLAERGYRCIAHDRADCPCKVQGQTRVFGWKTPDWRDPGVAGPWIECSPRCLRDRL